MILNKYYNQEEYVKLLKRLLHCYNVYTTYTSELPHKTVVDVSKEEVLREIYEYTRSELDR